MSGGGAFLLIFGAIIVWLSASGKWKAILAAIRTNP